MDSIHVTVAAIIRRKEHYLLVKERSSLGHIVYNQPSGHVELKESITQAVIREVSEETGLTFIPKSLIGTYLLSTATNGKTYLRFCFIGDVPKDEEASPQDPEIIANCWMTLDEITKLPKNNFRSGLVLQCIKDYLSGVRIPLETINFSNDETKVIDENLHLLTSKFVNIV